MTENGLEAVEGAADPWPTRPGQPTLVLYRRRGLTIGECYFTDESPDELPRLDFLRHCAVLDPGVPPRQAHRQTLVHDLRRDETTMLAELRRTARREVLRARDDDGLESRFHLRPSAAIVDAFSAFYDRFAASRGLRPVFRPRLCALRELGMLVISTIGGVGEEPFTWNLHVADRGHAVSLYSASMFRNLEDSTDRKAVGRANRYLAYLDMINLKDAGVELFDLGGADLVGRRPETANIVSFKRGFGGRPMATRTWSTPASIRGRVAAGVLRMRGVEY